MELTKRKWLWTARQKWRLKEWHFSSARVDYLIAVYHSNLGDTLITTNSAGLQGEEMRSWTVQVYKVGRCGHEVCRCTRWGDAVTKSAGLKDGEIRSRALYGYMVERNCNKLGKSVRSRTNTTTESTSLQEQGGELNQRTLQVHCVDLQSSKP